jgi:hypothetical protein
MHVRRNSETAALAPFYLNFEQIDFENDQRFQKFKKSTVEPIWTFR